MEEIKNNSHKAKQEAALVEKKVTSVAKGKTRKKSGIQRAAGQFINDDIDNVKSYVIGDVLIPAAKKAISDIVSNGIDMILYGETRHDKKRNNSDRVSYRSYYDDRDDRRNDRNGRSGYRQRNMFDYDDIIFDTRGEAEAVLDRMDEILDNYKVVSVLDLYDLADVTNDNSQTNKYGWTNIRNAQVVRVRDGYMLKLPKALPID